MPKKRHNERCRDCKESVKNFLKDYYGDVEVNWDLNVPCRLDEYEGTPEFNTLQKTHKALQAYRNFNEFVRSRKLPRVDLYVPSMKLIVEFDESQHFTEARDIALACYPNEYALGFSLAKWRKLCRTLNKRDNDPPYRDEQRAWYDTLRDFAPTLTGGEPTIRLYSLDIAWCSLSLDRESDRQTFKRIINNGA